MADDVLRDSVFRKAREIDTKTGDIREIQRSMLADGDRIRDFERQISAKQEHTALVQQRNTILTVNISSIKRRIDNKDKEIVQMTDLLERSKRELSAARERLESMEIQGESKLENDMIRQSDQIASIGRMDDLIERRTAAEADIERLKAFIKQTNPTYDELEDLEQQQAGQERSLSSMTTQLAGQDEIIDKLRAEKVALQSRLKAMKRDGLAKSKTLKAMTGRLAKMNAQRCDIVQCQTAIIEHLASLETAKDNAETLDARLCGLIARKERRDDKNRMMERQLANLKIENAEDQVKLDMLKERTRDFEIQSETKHAKGVLKKLDERYARLKMDRSCLVEEGIRLKAAASRLRDDISTADKRFREQQIRRDYYLSRLNQS